MSYQHGDTELAHALAGAMRRRGLEVWLDQEILVGTNIAARITDWISRADAVVVLVPPAMRASAYLGAETAAALAVQQERPRLRIIPAITSEPGDMPPLLAGRMHLDLRNGDVDSAAAQIAASLDFPTESASLERELASEITFTVSRLRGLEAQEFAYESARARVDSAHRASVALLAISLIALPLTLLALWAGGDQVGDGRAEAILSSLAGLVGVLGGAITALFARRSDHSQQDTSSRFSGEDREWTP